MHKLLDERIKIVKHKKILAVLIFMLVPLLFATWAQAQGPTPPSHNTPDTAVGLQAVNSGTLKQTEEHWYKFEIPASGYRPDKAISLELLYENGNPVSAEDRLRYPFVDFYIYFYDQGGNWVELGAGKEWTGQVDGNKLYYVGVINQSDFIVNYTLYDNNPSELPEPPVVEPSVAEPPAVPEQEQSQVQPAVAEITPNGVSPNEATNFNLTGLTRGRVTANSTGWRAVKFDDPGNTNALQHLTITCFATPFDGNDIHKFVLKLAEKGSAATWAGTGTVGVTDFGVIGINLRHSRASSFGDGDSPAQFIWDGYLIAGDEYLISFENGTGHEVDFWCFPQQMDNAELGKPSVRQVPVFAKGEAPSTAEQLQTGENDALLEQEEQLWYAFRVSDPGDGQVLEHVTVNMEFTPNDGSAGYSEGYKVNFDIFRAADLAYWSQTDFDNRQVQNIGAGSTIVTDNNRDTGQKTWDGWVNDGDLYFVQVRNGARYPVNVKIYVDGHEVSTLNVPQ